MGLFDSLSMLKETVSTITEAVKASCASDEAMAEIWEIIDEAAANNKLSPKLTAAYNDYVNAEYETLKLQEWSLSESDRTKKAEIDTRITAAKEKEDKALAILFPILDADTTLPSDVQAKIDEAIAAYNTSNAGVENLAKKFN